MALSLHRSQCSVCVPGDCLYKSQMLSRVIGSLVPGFPQCGINNSRFQVDQVVMSDTIGGYTLKTSRRLVQMSCVIICVVLIVAHHCVSPGSRTRAKGWINYCNFI